MLLSTGLPRRKVFHELKLVSQLTVAAVLRGRTFSENKILIVLEKFQKRRRCCNLQPDMNPEMNQRWSPLGSRHKADTYGFAPQLSGAAIEIRMVCRLRAGQSGRMDLLPELPKILDKLPEASAGI